MCAHERTRAPFRNSQAVAEFSPSFERFRFLRPFFFVYCRVRARFRRRRRIFISPPSQKDKPPILNTPRLSRAETSAPRPPAVRRCGGSSSRSEHRAAHVNQHAHTRAEQPGGLWLRHGGSRSRASDFIFRASPSPRQGPRAWHCGELARRSPPRSGSLLDVAHPRDLLLPGTTLQLRAGLRPRHVTPPERQKTERCSRALRWRGNPAKGAG